MGLRISRQAASYEQGPERSEPKPDAKPKASRDGLPPRLNEKLKQVRKLGNSSHPQLDRYAATATRYLKKKLQPDIKMTELDIKNLPTLIGVENSRHPGLNLSQYASPDAFLSDLAMVPEGSSRAIVRLCNPDGGPVTHHVMVDVQKTAGQAPTLIVLESARISARNITPHLQFMAKMRQHRIDTSRVAYVETRAQNSPNDCVMYCLNFALKAVKNSGVFDNMHRNIAQTGAPRPDISFEQHLAESDGLLGQWGAEQARQHLGNIGYAVGPLVLPPDFFKHATSATLAEEVSERAVQDCAPGELPATSRVNGTRHQAPESLEERVDAFMVTRPDDKGVKRTYSASIEGFRLQEIARAKMRSR